MTTRRTEKSLGCGLRNSLLRKAVYVNRGYLSVGNDDDDVSLGAGGIQVTMLREVKSPLKICHTHFVVV